MPRFFLYFVPSKIDAIFPCEVFIKKTLESLISRFMKALFIDNVDKVTLTKR